MLEKKRIRFIQILCLGTLAACQTGLVPPEHLDSSPSTPSDSTTVPQSTQTDTDNQSPPQANTPSPVSTAYQEAINLASGAFTLGQQATSPDDWGLIVGRWEQAIQKLNQVPTDDQQYATAQTKLKDYEQNLAQAKQQLANSQQTPAEISLNRPSAPANTDTIAATTPANVRIPILERRGGTPVIEVMVNGKRYPMVLDTGASHTHMPRAMANELGIQVVGQATVATASSRQVMVDVGYVDSIQVGNIIHRNLPVSIGDAVPIGLLGNDVYKNFDVILQANSVEFRPRQ